MSEKETTPPWKLVTAEQLKQGWIEMRGLTPVHHEYIVLQERVDRSGKTYVVRNPELWMLKHPLSPETDR